MALPDSWADALFGRLALRYGGAFSRQWPDLDIAAVKADWARVLDGVSGPALSYALDNLPAEKPPNAMQFRGLCRQWQGNAPALPAPTEPADPQRVKAALARMQATKRELLDKSPAQQCIDNIERACNGKPSQVQRHMVAHCLRMPGTHTTLAVKPAGFAESAGGLP